MLGARSATSSEQRYTPLAVSTRSKRRALAKRGSGGDGSVVPTAGGGVTATVTRELHSGPIPHPALLAGYAQLDPSFPQQIFDMAHRAAEHQRSMQLKALDADINDRVAVRRIERRGQLFALIFGCVSMAAGATAAVFGAPWPGGFFGLSGVGAIMIAFIVGRKADKTGKPEESDQLDSN